MRAISVWQPWASLLVTGQKEYETRSWKTDYRGPIAIHAAKKPLSQTMRLMTVESRRAAKECMRLDYIDGKKYAQTGGIVGIAYLEGCIEITEKFAEKLKKEKPREYLFGNFTVGRYALKMRDPVFFQKVIPERGRQGWWNWEPENEILQNFVKEYVGASGWDTCCMIEQPYCPICKFGLVTPKYADDDEFTDWSCLLDQYIDRERNEMSKGKKIYTEINALEWLLKQAKIPFESQGLYDGKQIGVPHLYPEENRISVIEHRASYGSAFDLLELQYPNGEIQGFMKAETALKLIQGIMEGRYEKKETEDGK